jgi:hypothetical protein
MTDDFSEEILHTGKIFTVLKGKENFQSSQAQWLMPVIPTVDGDPYPGGLGQKEVRPYLKNK